jgi:hypothetical protein
MLIVGLGATSTIVVGYAWFLILKRRNALVLRDSSDIPSPLAVIYPPTGHGSDWPAGLTTECTQVNFGKSWMSLDRCYRGWPAAEGARRADVWYGHRSILPPPLGGLRRRL